MVTTSHYKHIFMAAGIVVGVWFHISVFKSIRFRFQLYVGMCSWCGVLFEKC